MRLLPASACDSLTSSSLLTAPPAVRADSPLSPLRMAPTAGQAKAYTEDILSRMRLALVGGRPVTVQPIGRELAPRLVYGLPAGEEAFASSPRNGACQAGREETGPGP
jgi:hypothetical protein